jgi:nitrogenase iron protein NifH
MEISIAGKETMSKKTKHIAIYGKGGIGKSTTTSNISAALAVDGYRVIQIGCDPKSDSTNTLRNGNFLPTVLDASRGQQKIKIEDISTPGFANVLCIEAGGPVPGVGCAGRGVNAAVTLLGELHLFEEYKPDFVFYDVLGDVVCGGFAIPIRNGLTNEVYVVSSHDFMALYAANNLFKCITKYATSGGAPLGGIIANNLIGDYAETLVADFAATTKSRVVDYIPKSLDISKSELGGKTVVEAVPGSSAAILYHKIAKSIAENEKTFIPQPLDVIELRDWARNWRDKIIQGPRVF